MLGNTITYLLQLVCAAATRGLLSPFAVGETFKLPTDACKCGLLLVPMKIHRNFQLPDDHDMEPEHAERLLMEFAYHYVTALLKYASDNLKKGTSVRVAEP